MSHSVAHPGIPSLIKPFCPCFCQTLRKVSSLVYQLRKTDPLSTIKSTAFWHFCHLFQLSLDSIVNLLWLFFGWGWCSWLINDWVLLMAGGTEWLSLLMTGETEWLSLLMAGRTEWLSFAYDRQNWMTEFAYDRWNWMTEFAYDRRNWIS